MREDRSTRIIVGEVIAVIPEYHQAIVECGGYQYSVTRKNPGWDRLVEGDMAELEVYLELPLVKRIISVNKI